MLLPMTNNWFGSRKFRSENSPKVMKVLQQWESERQVATPSITGR
jgi:hypothetical protein